jgi:hypothetical protein
MSGINNLVDGIGADTGPQLAITEPLRMSGNIWYVNSEDTSTGGSGKSRGNAFKTLAAAVAAAADHDIISLLPTHQESITGTVTITKELTIVGEGKSDGSPMARLIYDDTTTSAGMLDIQAPCRLLNILFPANDGQDHNGPYVRVTADDIEIDECEFEIDIGTEWAIINTIATSVSRLQVNNSLFKVVGTETIHTNISTAVYLDGGCPDLKMRGTVFDWSGQNSSYYALEVATVASSPIRLENMSLLGGADVFLHPNCQGYVNVQTSTGGSKVVW